MSFIDLATVTMRRRNDLEGIINQCSQECDQAINNIRQLKAKAQGLVQNINCEPSDLKNQFLKSMNQVQEMMYLLTEFNMAIEHMGTDEKSTLENLPLHETPPKMLYPEILQYNLLDTLSEPRPSTSTACPNYQPREKSKRIKVPKKEELINFSSSSNSEESVQEPDTSVAKEIESNIVEEMDGLALQGSQPSSPSKLPEPCKLPAQTVLELDQTYEGTIMHVEGINFWIITDTVDEVCEFMNEMTMFYVKNQSKLSAQNVQSISYCALFEDDCYYRGLFVSLSKDDPNKAQVFLFDTGETRCVPLAGIQPLMPQFCEKPPFARSCHLAGIDLLTYNNDSLMKWFEELMLSFRGMPCKFIIDDNSSESLGVYVMMPTEEFMHDIIIKAGSARSIDIKERIYRDNSNIEEELDITQCPEYEDPVEAVTGYHNRDEADICKHYKGGPEKTCFKGSRCTKKHIIKHPDGWTLDQVEVPVKCVSLPLPEPGSWHKVIVTWVCHFDRVYVQFIRGEKEVLPEFGVVLPPMTLASLNRDMNCAAARHTYKPLKMSPAPGEMVAALYPYDNSWYRGQVVSLARTDQTVEVLYVDYGTTLWVKEDHIRELDTRYLTLPIQAVRCLLAGVTMRSQCSKEWANARKALTDLALDKMFDAHIIDRDYDEITVELYDKKGENIAQYLASKNLIKLTDYVVRDDTNVTQKVVVP